MSIKRTKYNGPPPPRNWGMGYTIYSKSSGEHRINQSIKKEHKEDEYFAPGKEFNERIQNEQCNKCIRNEETFISSLKKKPKKPKKPTVAGIPVEKCNISSKEKNKVSRNRAQYYDLY